MLPTRLVVAALTLSSTPGCKEAASSKDHNGNDIVVGRHTKTAEFYASDLQYLQKNANFFFRVWNETFTRRFDALPLKGEVPDDRKPSSGGYYAERDGGTHQIMVDGESPLQKYDRAFYGGQSRAEAWEKEKHTSGPEWAGHCNGFAATAQRHPKEPFKSVKRNGVTFAPQDIKALLAEIHMNADYEFLGGNRCEQTSLPSPGTRTDPAVMGECEDINPGTMHAAIANWVGRMHHTVVMDSHSSDEVWNFPLYKYEVVTRQDVKTPQDAAKLVGGSTTYKWNPSAVKFVRLQTKLTYAAASQRETLGQRNAKEMVLDYLLELDGSGEIVGGEWIGDQSRRNHPDFLWVALEPQVSNGTRFMGNQHLDNQEIIKMWAESVGADPANPPSDIKRPAGTDEWGRWSSFEVTLDGARSGAAFAGKPIAARIRRLSGLNGADINLDVQLNDASLKSIKTTGDEEITFSFDPGIGLNRLRLTWKKGNAVLEDQYLRFHVVR